MQCQILMYSDEENDKDVLLGRANLGNAIDLLGAAEPITYVMG